MTVAYAAKANNRKPEDRGFASNSIAIVADGVTRTPPPELPYPDPSPAAYAADVAVEVLSQALSASNVLLVDALISTNEEIARLNERLGLWKAYRDGSDDLAGTLAAIAVLREETVEWAYLGDCGVALLDKEGAVISITPDVIEPLRSEFPPLSEPPHLRMSWVREHFRNTEDERGFGVLTGEPAATAHIHLGEWSITSSCGAVVAFTDGARPTLANRRFREAVVDPKSTSDQLSEALQRSSIEQGLTDEATLAIMRPGETKA